MRKILIMVGLVALVLVTIAATRISDGVSLFGGITNTGTFTNIGSENITATSITNNQTANTVWAKTRFRIGTGTTDVNFTMVAPNGSRYCVGLNNTGQFRAKAGVCP